MATKKSLAVSLSKLNTIKGTSLRLEQYQTDSELAATLLWQANMCGDIDSSFIYDLGCGNGIFGIGALLLGAEHTIFVDVDPNAIQILNKNLNLTGFIDKSTVINKNISLLEFEVNQEKRRKKNVVIMNPPFGTHDKNADKLFLVNSFKFADVIYSIHYGDSRGFLEAIVKDYNFKITWIESNKFIISKSNINHKKNKHEVDIVLVRIEKCASLE
ncbi:MAG: METTL5 family protein [Candidatus Woesearchaeota archaeon]